MMAITSPGIAKEKHWDFDHWRIVSGFDIRISCFATQIVPRRFEGGASLEEGKKGP